MIQKLLRTYPASRIYCMTLIEANSGDHPRINEKGNTIADFNQRIKEIAAAYGLPVIDVHNCGMEVYELNHYTSDGTHPNKEGLPKWPTMLPQCFFRTLRRGRRRLSGKRLLTCVWGIRRIGCYLFFA